MQRSKGSENINAIIESVESRNNNSQQQQQQQCNSNNNNSQKNTRRSLSTSRIPSRKSYIGGNELSPLAAFDLKNFPYAGFTRLDDILSPKSSERSSNGERYCSYSQTSIKFPSTSNQNGANFGNVTMKDGFKLLLGETKGSSSSASRTTSNVNNFEPENQRITLKKVKPLLHIRSSLSKSASKDLKSVKRPGSSYSSQDEIDTLSTPLLSPNISKNSSPRIQMSTNGNPLIVSSTSLNPIPSQNKELNSNYLLKPAVKSLNYTQSDSSIKQISSSTTKTLNNNCSSNSSSQSGIPSNLHPYHNRSVGNVSNQTQVVGSNHSQQQSIRKVVSTSGHFPMIEKHQQKNHSSSINISGNSSNNKGSNDSSNFLVDINKNSQNSTSKYHVPKNHSSNVSTCSSSSNPSLSSPISSSKKVKNKSSINLKSFEESLPPTSSNEHKQQTMVEDLSKQIKNLIKENITLSKKVTFYENRDREKKSGESKLSPPVDRGKSSKSSLNGQNSDKSIIINDNHKAIENNQLKSQVDTLKYQNDKLKDENKLLTLENQKINKLLRDILYTLNARGYETLSDGHGNTIDLNRCKGETLLEMRGRDTRNRTGVRKNSPQELLLKAVIGSQERLIQNLVTQLDTQNRQRDLAANGQPMQGQNPYNTPGSRGDVDHQGQETGNNTNDGEVLALINVIEAICMRSHEVFFTLKDYLEAEYRERNVANILLENVLDRCEKYISPEHSLHPQTPLPRLVRSKMKSNKRIHQNDPKPNAYLMANSQIQLQLVPRGRPNRPQQTLCQVSHQQQHQHHHQQMQQSQHLKMSKISNENFPHLPTSSGRHQNQHPRGVNKPFPCLNSFPMLKIIDGSESNGHVRGTSAPGGNNPSTTMTSSNSPRPKHKIKSDSGSNSPRNPASSSSHMIGHSNSNVGQGQHQQYQFQHEEQKKPHVCHYCHKIFDHDTPQSQITAHYDLHFFKRNENFDENSTPPKPSTS